MSTVNVCRCPLRSMVTWVGPFSGCTAPVTSVQVVVGLPLIETIRSPAWTPACLAGAGEPAVHGAYVMLVWVTLVAFCTQFATPPTTGLSEVLGRPKVNATMYRMAKPRMKWVIAPAASTTTRFHVG